ncbi:MAG: hypothetical protein ACMXYD_05365 [Candidatus Woesearchaeota archaeon]
MPQETIHDLYVWKLSKDLQKQYDTVETNVVIHKKRRVACEIDILATKAGVTHVYEVKVSLRITKARSQFRKIRKYYSESIDKFFLYCGSSDSLLELEC